MHPGDDKYIKQEGTSFNQKKKKVHHLECDCHCGRLEDTMDPAHSEFGYNEHSIMTNMQEVFVIAIIAKKFGKTSTA